MEAKEYEANRDQSIWDDGFKAGEKKVVEWIRQHTCKTSPNMYGISLPFFVIGSKDWQEFLKSEGIE